MTFHNSLQSSLDNKYHDNSVVDAEKWHWWWIMAHFCHISAGSDNYEGRSSKIFYILKNIWNTDHDMSTQTSWNFTALFEHVQLMSQCQSMKLTAALDEDDLDTGLLLQIWKNKIMCKRLALSKYSVKNTYYYCLLLTKHILKILRTSQLLIQTLALIITTLNMLKRKIICHD